MLSLSVGLARTVGIVRVLEFLARDSTQEANATSKIKTMAARCSIKDQRKEGPEATAFLRSRCMFNMDFD